ncbi:MAG: ATP-binding protein [Candidatus Thorarchaeota archaeon]
MSLHRESVTLVDDPVRILVIEDSADDVVLLERVISKGGLNAHLEQVSTAEEMVQALDSNEWRVVLCDYSMPTFTVEDAMGILKDRGLDLPFIIVSGTISDDAAVRMMKAGAHDYMTKNNLSRLVPAIEREMKEAETRRKRKDAEMALVESERRHRTLVESIPDTIFVLESDLVVSEYHSSHAMDPDGATSQYGGESIRELVPDVAFEKIVEAQKRVLKTGRSVTFEYSEDCSGSHKWFSAKISRHLDGERIVVLVRDVTDLKFAEEAARAAHSVAMLYQDITGHDIRNALQAIVIASDLLYSEEPDPSKRSLIDHINASVAHCSELISAVQSTADLLITPLEPTSLDFTLKGCLTLFGEQHPDVQLETSLETSHAIINADRYLNNLIMNLLSNAIKYNSKQHRRIWARLWIDGKWYKIAISDNGPGITDDMKKNLLDPERRAGGVGIHQCVQIASKYGGSLAIMDRVDGDYSQGAMFVVSLPKPASLPQS